MLNQFSFFVYNEDFSLFGTQHLLVIALMVFLCIALPFFAKRYLNSTQQLWLGRVLAITVSFWALIYVVILWWLGDLDYKIHLPLDICNFTAVMLPFIMWKPKLKVHEILYFWILGGTIQAIITPHLYNGFPNFTFIKYWFVHAGLVIFAVYTTTVFDLKPNFKSIWKAFLALQVYVLFALLMNLLLGSNYVYLLGKPPVASALDYLGPWPWYLLVCEVLVIFIFFIVYLPILLLQKKSINS